MRIRSSRDKVWKDTPPNVTEMPARVLPPGLLDGRVCLLCSTWPRATRGGQPARTEPNHKSGRGSRRLDDRPTPGSPPSRPSLLAGLAESCLQWSLCHLETPGYPWDTPSDFSSRTWYRISLAYQNPSTHRPVFAREGHRAAR